LLIVASIAVVASQPSKVSAATGDIDGSEWVSHKEFKISGITFKYKDNLIVKPLNGEGDAINFEVFITDSTPWTTSPGGPCPGYSGSSFASPSPLMLAPDGFIYLPSEPPVHDGTFTNAASMADDCYAYEGQYGKIIGTRPAGSTGPNNESEHYLQQIVDDCPGVLTNADVTLMQNLTQEQIDQILEIYTGGAGGEDIESYDMCASIRNGLDHPALLAGDLTDVLVGVVHTSDKDGGSSSCAVDGIGWIICPVISFMAKANDYAYRFLADHFLQVEPELLRDSGTKAVWQSFRDIANVAFVVAFLIIIYGQITGGGITNYGIKKLLPRLIIAAILVNLSYYACQIAVDISNITGASVVKLFESVNVGGAGAAPGAVGSAWQTAATALLIVGVGVGLVVLVILAPSTLLIFAIIIMILLARKAFLLLLIVISPLAFVAYLLPNTEQWFKRWWKAFSTLLIVFPVIGVVFGASSLASTILLKVAGEDGQMMAVIALGVQAIPLFAVPVLLKGAMSAAGTVGAKLSGFSDKATSRAGRGIKNGRLGEAKTAFDTRRTGRRIARRTGSGFLATQGRKLGEDSRLGKNLVRVGTLSQSFDRTKAGKYVGGDRGAAAAAAAGSKIENDAVDNAALVMQKQPGWTAATTIDKAKEELSDAIKKGDTTRARAAQKILLGSGGKGIEELGKQLNESVDSSNHESSTVQYLKSDITGAGLKSKDTVLDTWSRDKSGSSVTEVARQQGAAVFSKLNDVELAGQSHARIKQAIHDGHIDSVRANEIINNQAAWVNMSEEKRALFRAIASSGAQTPGSTNGSSFPNPSSGPSNPPSGSAPPPAGP
jgi:hypothetical protein